MDREKAIQFHMCYCRHYQRGQILSGVCKAGEKIDGRRRLAQQQCANENIRAMGAPCVNGQKLVDVRSVCARWDPVTREEAEHAADADEAAVQRLIKVMPLVNRWKNTPPIGKQEIVECPICKGRLHMSQASSNGHVHGKCETPGCVSWME